MIKPFDRLLLDFSEALNRRLTLYHAKLLPETVGGMMSIWSKIKASDVDIKILAQVIRDTGRPVSVNKLAQAVVKTLASSLREQSSERLTEVKEVRRYTPSAAYTVGDEVRWKDKLGEVKAVANGENPRQGKFVVLTLVFPDGGQIRLAAKSSGEDIQEQESVSDRKVRAIVGEYGLAIRTAIQNAMHNDARFVWFQDTQGDNWCLTEMLPEVKNEDLAKVFPLLQGLLKDGVLSPRPTEELVKTIWGQSSDGSDEYVLKAFALNVALQGCNDTRWTGNGWVLESEWQKLQEREALIGPRQPSKIELPEGVTLDTSGESESVAGEVEEEEEPEEQETPIPEDLEAWRRNRRLHATFTLRARHYYGNWLSLNKDMRRVFPPRASGTDAVTFYHHLGDEQESFQAWVDWNQGRILGSPQMYQAFYDYGIYPGAALVISHRGNEQEYDIRTKPPTKDEPVRVRRVSFATDENGNRILGEDGHPKLEYEEYNEPRLYEVADEVFIVGVSWENLPELFAEAERVGQGYFGLMYEVCCEWWEANGRKPLYVTADELFQEIHYNRRLVTSEATIPWELWRRLAFKPVGDGRYLFRPQMGDRTRAVVPRSRTSRTRETRRGIQIEKDKSLSEIAGRIQVKVSVDDTAGARWARETSEESYTIRKTKTYSPPSDFAILASLFYLEGLITGKGTIFQSRKVIQIDFDYGRYKEGLIRGENVALDQDICIPNGVQQVKASLEKCFSNLRLGSQISLARRGYSYTMTIDLEKSSEFYEWIVQQFSGTDFKSFNVPEHVMISNQEELLRSYIRGFTDATGLITSTGRAGPSGRYRVFIRFYPPNTSLPIQICEIIQKKLQVPVSGIHWHDGIREYQMRVYAEDFQEIGFGMDWKNEILEDCAAFNADFASGQSNFCSGDPSNKSMRMCVEHGCTQRLQLSLSNIRRS